MRTFLMLSKKTMLVLILFFLMLLFTSTYWRERMVPTINYPFLCLKEYFITPIQKWILWREGFEQINTTAQKLLKERNDLLKELIRIKGTRDYLLACREGIEFSKRYKEDATLVVQILLKHFSDQGNYYFIDAGENRGITKDMVVLYDNCLIGRVSNVYAYYSKVILITDKESHVAARCLLTEARGILNGENNQKRMTMDFVSHLDTISDGDTVISYGEGLVFPRGFALGRVKSHELDGVSYRLYVEPLLDFSTLEYCMVLMQY